MKTTIDNLLRDRNLKSTKTRKRILELISDYGKAFPYHDIFTKLEDYDRVTLYRNVLALEEAGIIHKVVPSDGEIYYALCFDSCSEKGHQHQHIHFQCKICTEVVCLPIKKDLHVDVADYVVHDISVEAYGICPKCSKTN